MGKSWTLNFLPSEPTMVKLHDSTNRLSLIAVSPLPCQLVTPCDLRPCAIAVETLFLAQEADNE